MQNNLFKENVKNQLHISALEYNKLLNKIITIKSEQLVIQKLYLLKFTVGNFHHLTGVLTKLSSAAFFNQCFEGTIKTEDFDYNEKHNKNIIRNKLKCLIILSTFFNSELLLQEEFCRNLVKCKIALSNNSYTVGFDGGKKTIYPKTILNKNRFDNNKPIISVLPKIQEIK